MSSHPEAYHLATWDKPTYDQVASFLDSRFHIPKAWFYDLNSYTPAELVGSTIGIVAVVLQWKRADTETFARLVGSMGTSAALGANPLLLIVTVVALARAFHKAHQTGEYAEFVDGQFKGSIGSGATFFAASFVAGGPAGPVLGLLVGLTTGILVYKATKNVSIVQLSQSVAKQATAVATQAKEFAAQYRESSIASNASSR